MATGEPAQVATPNPSHDQLSWALQALRRSVHALMACESASELFGQVCEAVVDGDAYALAAVGLSGDGPSSDVRFEAAAGRKQGYIEGLVLSADADRAEGRGATGVGLRTGEPAMVRDFRSDAIGAPWRDRAARFGLRSSVTVPFKVRGAVYGALLVYSEDPDAFDTGALEVFKQLASEMGFAVELQQDRARLAATQAARLEAERDLAAMARDYKLLADHARDIILRYDREGLIVYASPSVRQLGFTPEAFIGRRVGERVHPEDFRHAEARVRAHFDEAGPGEVEVREVRVQAADGAWLWFEGTPTVVRDAEGRALEVVTQLRNVTQRREMEEELRRRSAEAEAAAVAKSEFLANMSHEIRTPLTAILGYADALRQDPSLTGQGRGQADRIAVAARSLQTLVDQILEYSDLDTGGIALEPEVFDPHALLAQACEMIREPAREKGLSLACDCAVDVPAFVEADAGRIRQVLLVLLENAVKFTEAGAVRASLSVARDDALMFSVSDTGVGVPADAAGRLFESFSQADGSLTRRFGGAGLGLALAKALVRKLGGAIDFESRPGEGARFWFSVPAPAVAAPPPATVRPGPPLRILVVDDAPMNCELVGMMLEALGCELTFARDGAEAVDKAQAAPFDLILMDMQMPVMDGPSAARAIRTSHGPNAGTPILAVSANVLPMQVQACLEAGMNDHIPKPINPHTLLDKVLHWAGATA